MARAIIVRDLSKMFEMTRKEEGFWNSVKGLFSAKKQYVKAVSGITFDIERGELIGFLGPNGAGKTTTLKMLSGILYPTSGSAQVLGYYPWDHQDEYKRQIAMVMGQKSQLWWDLPAIETFLLNRDIYEIPEKRFRKNLDDLSSMLNIDKKLEVPVRKLSLGQRMKCELIAALLHDPKVVFLDEPTIGLDVTSQKAVRNFIKEYNQNKNAIIILTSHYMEDVKELCKRVIIINQGEKIYDDSYSGLVKKYAQDKQIALVFDKKVLKKDLLKYGKILEFDKYRAVISVPRSDVKIVLGKVVKELPIDDIDVKEKEAADIIREIFG
ncbi:ATP-binding cassette domain-containing protein [Patescibacteria group bacterium]|nr:ATP-binding cassette domain-containing protein [Patescibacteria group bacterium]